MQKIIVVAKSDNHVIGKDNALVWHMPADLRFFKATIKGAYLITGRKSYESDQGRTIFNADSQFVILTRNKNYQSPSGKIASSLNEAIEIAEADNAKRVCILGGEAIYQEAMNSADQLIITEVHGHFEGDTFFPIIDFDKWQEISRQNFKKDAENNYDYSFVVYERIIN